MTIIQVPVSEETLARYGAQALTERLAQLLEWEELSVKAQEIHRVLQESGTDLDALSEQVRRETWEDYRQKFLKDILP